MGIIEVDGIAEGYRAGLPSEECNLRIADFNAKVTPIRVGSPHPGLGSDLVSIGSEQLKCLPEPFEPVAEPPHALAAAGPVVLHPEPKRDGCIDLPVCGQRAGSQVVRRDEWVC